MTDRTNAERQRRYIARLKEAAKAGASNVTASREHAALAKKLARAEARIAELEAELSKAKAPNKAARRARHLLRLLGIDPSGLSAAEVAEGVEAARRVTQCDGVPGAGKRRPQAIADWQTFVTKVTKPASPDTAELAQAKARNKAARRAK